MGLKPLGSDKTRLLRSCFVQMLKDCLVKGEDMMIVQTVEDMSSLLAKAHQPNGAESS